MAALNNRLRELNALADRIERAADKPDETEVQLARPVWNRYRALAGLEPWPQSRGQQTTDVWITWGQLRDVAADAIGQAATRCLEALGMHDEASIYDDDDETQRVTDEAEPDPGPGDTVHLTADEARAAGILPAEAATDEPGDAEAPRGD